MISWTAPFSWFQGAARQHDDCSENPVRDSAMGATRTLTPHAAQGVTPLAGGRASVVPDPESGHRLRRAVVTDTDRPLEAGGGGRREESHSAPSAPRGSGGDKTGYGATPGPDCWASSRPQLIRPPLARHRPPSPSLPGPTPVSSYQVSH